MLPARHNVYQLLWIESRRVKVPDFVGKLRRRGYEVHVVASGKAALEWLGTFTPDAIVLYAASFGTSGCRMARTIHETAIEVPLLLIASPEAPPNPKAPVSYTLMLPFTVRKLINRLTEVLPPDPPRWLAAGPIQLDEERRIVRCGGKEARLTPRLARLLRYFLLHPNEVLPYDQIFRAVWETDFTGDTRTLQVHVSWLRRALGDDPRHPRLLQTLRGIGYRLWIAPPSKGA